MDTDVLKRMQALREANTHSIALLRTLASGNTDLVSNGDAYTYNGYYTGTTRCGSDDVIIDTENHINSYDGDNLIAFAYESQDPSVDGPDITIELPGTSSNDTSTDGVDSMWEDFSVDTYAPQVARLPKPQRKPWKPKTTIPQPFSFVENPPQKKKSRSLLMYEDEQRRKREEEEYELAYRFQPTRVPATTKLSLFDEIVNKPRQRRPTNTPHGTRQHDLPLADVYGEKAPRPRPSEDDANVSSWEEFEAREMVRRQARHERARAALAKARAPADLDKRGMRRTCVAPRPSFQPQINRCIPDYAKQEKEFHQKLTAQKQQRPPTKPKPFNFRTERLVPSTKNRVALDIEMDEMTLPETRWPFLNTRTKAPAHPLGPKAKAFLSLGQAASAPPPKSTHSVELRDAAVREREAASEEHTERVNHQRKLRKARARRLREAVVQQTQAQDDVASSMRRAREAERRERTAVQKALEQQYEVELALMLDRVERQPLLAERCLDPTRI
eukprot:m.73296 g.73296  ORF g.73296 m.73296 type:complete len:501 (+) comp16122_c0_seq1:148-1650(+)